jgi:putative ABC transport system substrate-binding protein
LVKGALIFAPGNKSMRWREFVALLGGAAVMLPLAVRAQQPAMQVIGFLSYASLESAQQSLAAFHQGLKDAGFVADQNVAIEYRWANGQYDRLPKMAADLVRRQVTVIFCGGSPSVLAAKSATTTMPIVFTSGQATRVLE